MALFCHDGVEAMNYARLLKSQAAHAFSHFTQMVLIRHNRP